MISMALHRHLRPRRKCLYALAGSLAAFIVIVEITEVRQLYSSHDSRSMRQMRQSQCGTPLSLTPPHNHSDRQPSRRIGVQTLIVDDIDGDGTSDILASSSVVPEVCVWRMLKSGVEWSHRTITTHAHGPVVANHFPYDGRSVVVAFSESERSFVSLSCALDSDFIYPTPRKISIESNGVSLAVVSRDRAQVEIMYSPFFRSELIFGTINSSGDIQNLNKIALPSKYNRAEHLTTGDLDADGRPDVIGALSGLSNDLVVLLMSGHEWALNYWPMNDSANRIESLLLVDINRDGRSDVVFSHSLSLKVGAALSSDEFSGGGAVVTSCYRGIDDTLYVSSTRSLLSADLDSDGLDEVIGLDRGNGGVIAWSLVKHGLIAAPTCIYSRGDISQVSCGDVNNDGLVDVVCALRGSCAVDVVSSSLVPSAR